jgi:hypothetical protein
VTAVLFKDSEYDAPDGVAIALSEKDVRYITKGNRAFKLDLLVY